MIEKHFLLEEADPATFFGAGNANLRLLRALRPKLRIIGRDNVLKVMGAEEDMAEFEETFAALQRHCARFNQLSEEEVVEIYAPRRSQHGRGSQHHCLFHFGQAHCSAFGEPTQAGGGLF